MLVGVIPRLFQFFCDHFIFFRRSWILHRAVYAAYDYNFIYINAALGVANTIFHVLMLFVVVPCFARLDRRSCRADWLLGTTLGSGLLGCCSWTIATTIR